MATATEEAVATSVPVATPVSEEIQKAVTEALGDLVDKVKTHEAYFAKASREQAPKAWFADPFALLDSLGMGYRTSPSFLTYDTLRITSERDTVTAAIIATRVNQVAAFARPQQNKYSVGFKILPRGGDHQRRLRDSEKERIREIEFFLLNTGIDYNPSRDSFETFLRKSTRDSLTYDQMCWEKVRTHGGGLHSVFAVPSDTIRVAHPATPKATPPDVAELKRQLKYVQLINAQIVNEYTQDEMSFGVRNPRTHVKVYGYGMPEIETLMTTITAHMWAEEWNRRAFSQGSTVKGVLNLKGNIPPAQFETFKRQWAAQVAGVTNAWKTPVINADGIEWMPVQMNNTEMGYQFWIEYLVKIETAIFQMDPAEINFDLRGGAGQQPVFMSTNEAQQKVSKDRGLQPLLRFLEDQLNRQIIWAIDPRFEIGFFGLDAKTEEQAIQLRMQQVQNIYTLNEVRALEDLPPVKHGDVVLNPTFTGYANQKDMAASQQQMMGGAGGMPPGMPGQPPPGGAPGGQQPQLPPGQDQGEPPYDPSQPYKGHFMLQPPNEVEQQGADNLRQVAEEKSSPEPAAQEKESSSSASSVSSSTMHFLHLDDWVSSKHAALTKPDLVKAESDGDVLIDTIDLE